MKSTRTIYIADQTVYRTADNKAVGEDYKEGPKFLLVQKGQQITEEQAEKYDGALALIGTGEAKKEKPAPKTETVVETRTPAVQHRDPKHHK